MEERRQRQADRDAKRQELLADYQYKWDTAGGDPRGISDHECGPRESPRARLGQAGAALGARSWGGQGGVLDNAAVAAGFGDGQLLISPP